MYLVYICLHVLNILYADWMYVVSYRLKTVVQLHNTQIIFHKLLLLINRLILPPFSSRGMCFSATPTPALPLVLRISLLWVCLRRRASLLLSSPLWLGLSQMWRSWWRITWPSSPSSGRTRYERTQRPQHPTCIKNVPKNTLKKYCIKSVTSFSNSIWRKAFKIKHRKLSFCDLNFFPISFIDIGKKCIATYQLSQNCCNAVWSFSWAKYRDSIVRPQPF